MNAPINLQIERARAVAGRLRAAGASECMLVGGFVRDCLMGIESKDIDVEVYGLGYDQIVSTLKPHYVVDLVGRNFGVVKVVKVDNQIDIHIPRRESKSGVGHKGFDVHPDPTMTPREAAARRDFTINSMAMKFSGEIFDPFEGRKDLERGILRATSATFKDDPLRVLRGMQFAARFGFDMDDSTEHACREMIGEYRHLPEEQVWEEWHKWAVKGRCLSKGLQLLDRTGWIVNFPVLHQMTQISQDPIWHPEGNVFVHTTHCCDVAVEIADREGLDSQQREILVFATLCHDFGKTTTTTKNDHNRWIAPEHAAAGAEVAKNFLAGMKAPSWLLESVLPLVAEHMVRIDHPKHRKPSARVVRRLATRLTPATVRLWSWVCEADHNGRPPRPKKDPVAEWVEVAECLELQDGKPQPLLLGRHLIPLGYPPGPSMGVILKAAFEAQLDGEIQSVEEAIVWVQDHHALERTQIR